MLVLGFSDAYQEMSADTAAAIQQYIGTGKSSLFSHDCASYYSLPDKDYQQQYKLPLPITEYVYTGDTYGYNFNTVLRDSVGLDRYGVTSAKKDAGGTQFGTMTSKSGNAKNSGIVATNNGGGLTGTPDRRAQKRGLQRRLQAEFRAERRPHKGNNRPGNAGAYKQSPDALL